LPQQLNAVCRSPFNEAFRNCDQIGFSDLIIGKIYSSLGKLRRAPQFGGLFVPKN
jgi:hypothetical protein